MVITLSPPEAEPITLSEAREHCRVDGNDQDAVLSLCIAAARSKCEGIIKSALVSRTVEQAFDAFPEDEIALELGPVSAIVSVTYMNEEGAEQTLSPLSYSLDNRSYRPWLLPALGSTWPATEASVNAVKVRYVAGFGAPAAVPPDIKAWLLMTVGYLHTQRESIDLTGRAKEIPNRFVDALLDPWRVYG